MIYDSIAPCSILLRNDSPLPMRKMIIVNQTEPRLLNNGDISIRMFLVQNIDIKERMI